jgi:hypothetical protein
MKNIFEPKNLNRQDNNKQPERFLQLFPYIKKFTSYLYTGFRIRIRIRIRIRMDPH